MIDINLKYSTGKAKNRVLDPGRSETAKRRAGRLRLIDDGGMVAGKSGRRLKRGDSIENVFCGAGTEFKRSHRMFASGFIKPQVE